MSRLSRADHEQRREHTVIAAGVKATAAAAAERATGDPPAAARTFLTPVIDCIGGRERERDNRRTAADAYTKRRKSTTLWFVCARGAVFRPDGLRLLRGRREIFFPFFKSTLLMVARFSFRFRQRRNIIYILYGLIIVARDRKNAKVKDNSCGGHSQE